MLQHESMTLLPPQAIDEFQTLWKKHYGVELPREQAIVRAHQVYTVVRLLIETSPLPQEQLPKDTAPPPT